MGIFSNFWRWIGSCGIKKSYAPEYAREIEFINQAAFMTFVLTSPSIFIVYFYFSDPTNLLLSTLICFYYWLVLIFNRLRFHQLAKISLFAQASLNTFWASSTFGYAGHTHFVFIVIIFATILAFNNKDERKSLFAIFALIIILLAVLFLTDFSLFLVPNIEPTQQRAISWIVLYFGIIGGIVVAYFYIHKFTQQTYLVEASNILLQAKFDELQKLNSELDRFVYSASHDLRAPITSVLGLVYLGKKTENLVEIQQYFDLQEKSLKKLDSFIADILNYSRNNRAEIQKQSINFQSVIENILELQTQYDTNHRIQTFLTVKQELSFFTDAQRLAIALNNLISNSFRYYNDYQAPSWLKIAVEVDMDRAIVTISDNGIGIGKEHLPRIFEMFYRATDRTIGSGLGLYIVKEVVEKLQGAIKVDSALGKGTTFTIEIPNLNN